MAAMASSRPSNIVFVGSRNVPGASTTSRPSTLDRDSSSNSSFKMSTENEEKNFRLYKERKNESIFHCNKRIEDLSDFLINKDIEQLLKSSSEIPVKTINEPLKSDVEIFQVKKKPPLNSNDKYVSKRNTPPPDSIGKIRRNYETDHLQSFLLMVKKHENFVFELGDNLKKSLDEENLKHSSLMKFSKEANPLNRATWKAMKELNAFGHKYPQQYLKVQNQEYLLSGSKGGNVRDFHFSETVQNVTKKVRPLIIQKLPKKKPKIVTVKPYKYSHKKGLLTSMNVSFKPGPLSRKPDLDETAYNSGLGELELVKLPSVGLEILPQVGLSLDPHICAHLKHVRNADGTIDAAWAKFAVSLVQTRKEDKIKSISHTFTIPYENNRSRVLMRKDLDMNQCANLKNISKENKTRCSTFDLNSPLKYLDNYKAKDDVETSIKSILSDLLQTVCIGEIQDKVSKIDPDSISRQDDNLSFNLEKLSGTKKQYKRKYVNELKKLNITIIDIEPSATNIDCSNDFCKKGCVCASLQRNYLLNEHCGLPECMFECKCNLDEKSFIDQLESDRYEKIPHSAVINLQNQMNRNLSKEEKKFQHTVIRSNDQTIILGARRRGIRAPKRFEDFRPLLDDENEKEIKKAKIVLPKLPKTIDLEPWCMVHQLYRCFCKGVFVEGSKFDLSINYDHENSVNVITSTPCVQNKASTNCYLNMDLSYSCARTTFDKLLKEKVLMKNSLYASRNENLKKKHNVLNVTLDKDDNLPNTSNDDSNTPIISPLKTVQIVQNESLATKEIDLTRLTVINAMKTQIPALGKISNLELVPKVRDPVAGEAIVVSWCTFMVDYLLEKISIWLIEDRPYKQLVTLKSSISCPYNCINIKKASKDLLAQCQPYIIDIVNKKMLTNTFCLLYGRHYAWEMSVMSVKENLPYPNKPLVKILPKKANIPTNSDISKLKVVANNNDKFKPKPVNIIIKSPIKEKELPPLLHFDNKNDKGKKLSNTKSDVKNSPIVPAAKPETQIQKTANESNDDCTIISDQNTAQPNLNYKHVENKVSVIKCKVQNHCEQSKIVHNKTVQSNDSTNSNRHLNGKVKDSEQRNKQHSPLRINKDIHALQNISNLALSTKSPETMSYTHKSIFDISQSTRTKDKNWLMIKIGNDFREMYIHCKHFAVRNEDIFRALEICHMKKNIVRLPAYKNPNSFALYALPGDNVHVFLGPFLPTENSGITIEANDSSVERKCPSLGVWINPTAKVYPFFNRSLLLIDPSKEHFVESIDDTPPQTHVINVPITAVDSRKNDTNQTSFGKEAKCNIVIEKLDDGSKNNAKSLIKKKESIFQQLKDFSIDDEPELPPTISKQIDIPYSISINNNVRVDSRTNLLTSTPSAYDTESDDDVVIIPNTNEVLEISDSE